MGDTDTSTAEDQHDDDGQGEDGTLEARMGRVETEQKEQRGILEQIRDRLGGAEGKAHAKAQAHTEDRLGHPPAETIAAQVKKAVEDVDAERAAREAAAKHDADHERLRREAERPPREMASGFRGRVQSALFGGPDS